MFSAKNNILSFNQNAIKTLPGIIKEFFVDGDYAIVHYDIDVTQHQYSQVDDVCKNVRAFDKEGEEIWTIEYKKDRANYLPSFTGMIKRGNEFWAYRSDGWDVNFDPSNGKIIQNILGR